VGCELRVVAVSSGVWAVSLGLGTAGPALPAVLCLLALVPIAFLSVAFPEGGSQPFVASAFWPALAGGGRDRTWRSRRSAGRWRIGALLYAAGADSGRSSCPSAVGGNADRLGARWPAGPPRAALRALLGAAQPLRAGACCLVLVLPLTYWQANAPVTDFVSTVSNRSTRGLLLRAPLLAELGAAATVGYGRRPARSSRVGADSSTTGRARFVAPGGDCSREGWERQLDRLSQRALLQARRAADAAAL